MFDQETPAERYRGLAHQRPEIARAITNHNARVALIEVAQVWDRLADQQDDKKE